MVVTKWANNDCLSSSTPSPRGPQAVGIINQINIITSSGLNSPQLPQHPQSVEAQRLMIREMFAKMTLDHPLTPRYVGKNVFLFGYVTQIFRPKFHDYQLPIAGLSSTHNVSVFLLLGVICRWLRLLLSFASWLRMYLRLGVGEMRNGTTRAVLLFDWLDLSFVSMTRNILMMACPNTDNDGAAFVGVGTWMEDVLFDFILFL